jgi:gamma-carbonic anhydrase
MTILNYKQTAPKIAAGVFIAPQALVIGDVEIGAESSVWFNTVVRGDVNIIRIGARTNIQDNSVVHVTKGGQGTYIGDDVTIGHACILHDCTLESSCFIGMGSLILDRARISSGAMVAAGSLVVPGKAIPGGELWGGRPAKFMRNLTDEEKQNLGVIAARYVGVARDYSHSKKVP